MVNLGQLRFLCHFRNRQNLSYGLRDELLILLKKHKIPGNFAVEYGISGCPRTYCKFSALCCSIGLFAGTHNKDHSMIVEPRSNIAKLLVSTMIPNVETDLHDRKL